MKHVVVLGSLAESLVRFRGPLLRAMVERGHRVIGCAPAASQAVIDALAAMGVTYRDVPLKRSTLRPDRDLRTLFALTALFREMRPDVLLSYTVKPVVYGLLAARLAGVSRRFAMIEGLGYVFENADFRGRFAGSVARRLYRLALASADGVFFLNPNDQAAFVNLKLISDRTHTLVINGIGIQLDVFKPAPVPRQASFLLISRLLRNKGVREYVEAARLLRTRHPEVPFRLVGWIDDNPAAISRRELDVWVKDGVIDYVGRLDDVRPAIAASSVFVLPSYYREGLPQSSLEAMAMGRPLITTDEPGCRETVVPGENGFFVPARDPVALAAAMERFIADPCLASVMGRRSRLMAEERFDVHRVNAVMLDAMGLQ